MLARLALLLLISTVAYGQEGSGSAAGSGSGSGSGPAVASDPEAQAAFDRAEKTWMDASGLAVGVTAEFVAPEEPSIDGSRVAGTFHAAGPSCALRWAGKVDGNAARLVYVVSGTRSARAEWTGDDKEPPLDPREIDAAHVGPLRRAAFRGSMFLLGRKHLDPSQFAVVNIRLLEPGSEEGREICRIAYELKIEDQPETAKVELWLDASGLPKRRILKVSNHPGRPVVTLTETYEAKIGDVPAERFAIPEAKPEPPK